MKLWQDVVAKSPQKARGYFSLGVLYAERKKNLDRAIDLYTKGLSLDPKNIEARNNLARFYFQKGNPKGLKSVEDLTQADLKVALTDPQYSTAGEMVFALLEKKGIKVKMVGG